MHTLSRDDLRLTWSPPESSKEATFGQLPDYPWCSSAIPDLLKASRSKLGIIYVNSALVPWTLSTVSSCVREFWSWPYLLLSTLSRSASWPASIGAEEGDRWAQRGRDAHAMQRRSLHLSSSWQRPFGSPVIYFCSSSLKVWPPPKTRQLTHIQLKDASQTLITFFFLNKLMETWWNECVLYCDQETSRYSLFCMN